MDASEPTRQRSTGSEKRAIGEAGSPAVVQTDPWRLYSTRWTTVAKLELLEAVRQNELFQQIKDRKALNDNCWGA